MGTHNIDFFEDLTKIIFQLSSNIIKYASSSETALMQRLTRTFAGCHNLLGS